MIRKIQKGNSTRLSEQIKKLEKKFATFQTRQLELQATIHQQVSKIKKLKIENIMLSKASNCSSFKPHASYKRKTRLF